MTDTVLEKKEDDTIDDVKEAVTFKSLIDLGDSISREEIIHWLRNADDITINHDCDVVFDSPPIFSKVIDDYDLVEEDLLFLDSLFDPDTAGVIVEGLSYILTWYATRQMHKEDKNIPPTNEIPNRHEKDRCSKLDGNIVCSRPLFTEFEMRTNEFVICVFSCSKTPPHRTVMFDEF